MRALDPARTGFDFDGVIADTMAAFLRIACEDYGHCGHRLEDITRFDLKPLPIDQEILEEIFVALTDRPLAMGVLPMPGAAETLARLSEIHPVTIVTARPDPGPVEEWLAHFCGPAAARIRVLHSGGDHDAKMGPIRAAGLAAFIDDRAETCLDLARAGIDAHVYEQPWNRGRHHLPVLRGWDDVARLFGI